MSQPYQPYQHPKRPAPFDINPQPARRHRGEDDGVNHPETQAPQASVSLPQPVTVEEHKTRLESFSRSIIGDITAKFRHAYIQDMVKSKELCTGEEEEWEASSFLFNLMQNLDSAMRFGMKITVTEMLEKKPEGSWYRKWLDSGEAHSITWPRPLGSSGVEPCEVRTNPTYAVCRPWFSK